MTDQEKIDSIRKTYGNHVGSDSGNWLAISVKCPNCKEGYLNTEPNMELEGAATDQPAECDDCGAKYDWAYVIEPEIIINRIE